MMQQGFVLLCSLVLLLQDSSVQALKGFHSPLKTAMSDKNNDNNEPVFCTSEREVENRNPLSIEAHVLNVVRRGAIESFQSKMVPEDPNPNNKHNPLWVEEYVYTGERRGPEMTEQRKRQQRSKRSSLLASTSFSKK